MAEPVEQPIPEVPAVETASEVVAPETPAFAPHTDTPTLLGEATAPGAETPVETPAVEVTEETPAEKTEPEKPADTTEAKPEEAKPEETNPAEATPQEPISYPDWKLPEGIEPDKERLAEFTGILSGIRVPPEVGQQLLDMHTATFKQFADGLVRQQHETFANTRAEWRKQAMADSEIGGAGHQTAMGAIARVRDAVVSSARPGTPQYDADVKELNEMLAVTGVGDHPFFLRMIHRMARFVDEPKMPPANIGAPANGGMPPGGLKAIYKANREARENGQN